MLILTSLLVSFFLLEIKFIKARATTTDISGFVRTISSIENTEDERIRRLLYRYKCEHFYVDMGTNVGVQIRKLYQAENGKPGKGNQMTGKSGKNLVVRLPPGTLVKNEETGELLVDLKETNKHFVVAKGGQHPHKGLRQDDIAHLLKASEVQRGAGLILFARNGFDRPAHDFGPIGPDVQAKSQHSSLQRAERHPQERQDEVGPK